MIKPDPGFEKNDNEMFGIGLVLAVWTKDWKATKNGNASIHSGGKNEWKLLRSKPKVIGDDTGIAQLWIGNSCNNVTGLIDDIAVYEAYTNLSLKVDSSEVIRQITVTNDMGKIVFDSGILKDDKKTFEKTIQVETPYVYTVRAIDYDGDVVVKTYPEK